MTPSPVVFAIILGVNQVLPAQVQVQAQTQGWTSDQLTLANTAATANYMTPQEKEAVLYINLCRLYPQEFLTLEFIPYTMDPDYPQAYHKEFVRYKLSLLRDLEQRKPAGVLQVDRALFQDGKCYATEISTQHRSGHQRIDCKEHHYAECISYGQESGKDIAMQWLFDVGVESLGHRHCCLDKDYTAIGLRADTHFKYDTCAVAEFQ